MIKGLHLTLLFTFFALFISCGETQQKTTPQNSQTAGINQAADDGAEPEVVITVYSDFQCPACKYYVPFESQLKREFGSRIKIVNRNFPLPMHQYAQLAARAAEAARKQGKFDEMHDKLFEGQEQWSMGNAESLFNNYAKAIGLDMNQFKKDLNSIELQQKIMAEKQEGIDRQVDSTPTYFINGDKVQNNPPTYPQFKALVTPYLKS